MATEAAFSGNRGKLSTLALGFPLPLQQKHNIALVTTLPGSNTF